MIKPLKLKPSKKFKLTPAHYEAGKKKGWVKEVTWEWKLLPNLGKRKIKLKPPKLYWLPGGPTEIEIIN